MSETSERLKQETIAAYARLGAFGKSTDDVRAFLTAYIAYTRGERDFDSVIAGWSVLQVSAALEAASISAWHVALLHPTANRDRLTAIMLDHARYREDRLAAQVNEKMLPDYERGKKSREGGAKAHGTEEERLARAVQLHNLDQQLKPGLSRSRRSHLVAKNAAKRGIKVSAKTVERELKKYASFLQVMPASDGK
jgi:hypothetical protein